MGMAREDEYDPADDPDLMAKIASLDLTEADLDRVLLATKRQLARLEAAKRQKRMEVLDLPDYFTDFTFDLTYTSNSRRRYTYLAHVVPGGRIYLTGGITFQNWRFFVKWLRETDKMGTHVDVYRLVRADQDMLIGTLRHIRVNR